MRGKVRASLGFILFIAGSAAAEDRTLKILSYNLHGLPMPIVRDFGQYQRIGEILGKRRAEGTAPDVVVVQEGFTGDVGQLLQNAAYPYVKRGPKNKFLRLGSGLWILSEFPITKVHRIVYDDCASWDCFSRKGAIHVRLQIPGVAEAVDIYDTHLNSDPDVDPFTSQKKTRNVRMRQIHELAFFVSRTKSENSVVLIPGDFNFKYGDTDYNFFGFLTNMANAASVCAENRGCSGDSDYAGELRQSVDHQFFADTGGNVKVEPLHFERNFKDRMFGMQLSDHTGLEVHYRLSW